MSGSGFLLYDKPAGITSFVSLAEFKKADPSTKFGHAGTLDRFATGLLIVLAGPYSRLAPWFQGLDKAYRAQIRFGSETDTLDPDGAIVRTEAPPSVDQLQKCLPSFLGAQQQIPPEYSALHFKGARASSLARRGQHPALASRPIVVSSLELLDYDGQCATFDITCSSGTYVRALARDIASACDSCAHVVALRRTRVGPFSVDAAVRDAARCDLHAVLAKFDRAAALGIGLGIGRIPPAQKKQFAHGFPGALSYIEVDSGADRDTEDARCLSARDATSMCDAAPTRDIAVFSDDGDFLGIVEEKIGDFRYRIVISGEEERPNS